MSDSAGDGSHGTDSLAGVTLEEAQEALTTNTTAQHPQREENKTVEMQNIGSDHKPNLTDLQISDEISRGAPRLSKKTTGSRSRRLDRLKGMQGSTTELTLRQQDKMLQNMDMGYCPNGHGLTKVVYDEAMVQARMNYICDYCFNVIDKVRYQCRLCDFDFCASCYLKIRLGNNTIDYLKVAKWLNDITPTKKKQVIYVVT